MISIIAELDSGTKMFLGLVFAVGFSMLMGMGEDYLKRRFGRGGKSK